MESAAFHELLLKMKGESNQELRKDIEATYYAFRSQNPTDCFVELMFKEMLQDSPVQEFAQVLLRQDIEKLEEQNCIRRLSDPSQGRQLILNLMAYTAENPSNFLVQIISAYAVIELTDLHAFPEIFEFIQQGAQSENRKVRVIIADLFQELCELDAKVFPFDQLSYLQQLLEDKDDEVAKYTCKALQKVIEYCNNKDETELPTDTVKQIILAMLTRIVQSLTNGSFEYADKMFQSLNDIIDVAGESVVEELPSIISLLEQVVHAEVTDKLKARAIYLFETMCASCESVRKYLLDIMGNFVRTCIIPNLTMNDNNMQEWLQTENDYEYEDDSIQAVSEDCLETVSKTLGKQVVQPLLHEILEKSHSSNDWHYIIAALNAIKYSSEGIQDVLKQGEIDQYVKNLITFMQNENPRVRYDAVDALAIISDDFKPRCQKLHKKIIPVLLQMKNDPNIKVRRHVIIAMTNFCQHLNHEQIYQHQEPLYNLVKEYFTEDMKMQTGSMVLLACLCDKFDTEDLHPMLLEFMPTIFQSFEQIMQAMHEVPEFTKIQVDFIEGVIDSIQAAANNVPELFNDYIEMILENLVFIVSRSEIQREFNVFQLAMGSVQTLVTKYKEKCRNYVDSLYPMFIKVLTTDPLKFSSNPLTEAEHDFDPNQQHMQTQILITLSDMMDHIPDIYGQHFDELLELLKDFKHCNLDQLVSKHECLAELIHVADQCNFDVESAHNVIFPLIMKEICPADCVNQTEHYEQEQIGNQADAMQTYINTYLKFIIKTENTAQIQETLPLFFEIMSRILESAKQAMKMEFQEIEEASNFDAEERRAEMEDLLGEYDDTMDSIGAAYSEFMLQFKEAMPAEALQGIVEAAKAFFVNGVTSDFAVVQSMQGIALYSDLAEFTTPEICMQVFPEIFPTFLEIIKEKQEDFQLMQIIYYALACFLRKTHNKEVAQNADLLVTAVSLLDSAKENGGEEALNCYDNLCGYLQISGYLAEQGVDYWNSLIQYCSFMQSDGEEVASCILFFLDNLKETDAIKQLENKLPLLFVNLFFGEFYSAIKNEPSNAEMIQQLKEFLQKPEYRKDIEQAVRVGSDFVRKNFQAFFE